MKLSPSDLGARISGLLAPGSAVRLREPLAPRTTLKVGGAADCYVEPCNEADLAAVVRFCAESYVPLMFLGRGSNLLVRDGGIRGVVVSLAHPAFGRIEGAGDHLWCGAGARLKAVAQAAREQGLGGFEFFEGIPGTLGGALRMNAGAMGAWTFEIVERVRLMDRSGEMAEYGREALVVRYRECQDLRERIALAARLRGRPEPRERIEERRRAFNARRWSTQPAAASAGCMFKNPAAIPAGRLIDELGLKGQRVGGAAVSEVHANFMVNLGGASARDVLTLIELVQQRARLERGIELETEVEVVGEELRAEEPCCR